MTTIDTAERKSRARALAYLLFAGLELAMLGVLIMDLGPHARSFTDGFWAGLTLVAALYMLPFGRWLRPRDTVMRLLEDETTPEHRHQSATAGFWAAIALGLGLALMTPDSVALRGFDVARLIVTAALGAALTRFALLELKAAR